MSTVGASLTALALAYLVVGRQIATAETNGTDWRYPQHIVQPLVPCSSEGFFSHPRDCSWFYRCHDPHRLGVYLRYYFQCDPMKIYVTSMGKCDFVHVVRGNFSPSPPCTLGIIDVTSNSSVGGTEGSLPSLDEVDNTIESIISSDGGLVGGTAVLDAPDFVLDPSKCIIMIADCQNKQICSPTTFDHLQLRRVCDRAFFRCPHQSTFLQFDLCRSGTVYNPAERYCMYDVLFCQTSMDSAYPPAVPPFSNAGPPSPPTVATTTTQPYVHPFLTITSYTHPPYPPPTTQMPTTAFTTTTTTTATTTPATTTTTTTPRPITTIFTTPSTTTTTEDSSGLLFLNFNETVRCSESNTVPLETWMKRYYCFRYHLCTPAGEYRETTRLCHQFLKCGRMPDGSWYVTVMRCPLPWLYSFKTQKCAMPPTDSEQCDGGVQDRLKLRRQLPPE